MKKTQIYDVLRSINTVFVFFINLFRICMTKFELIKLKCYITTLL